jgi:hypothetical protein
VEQKVPIALVDDFVAAVRLGAPRAVGGLTLVSVIGPARPEPQYVLSEEAVAEGTLKIGERDIGAVSELLVHNAGPLPVLFVDGEHLEGAMQNRVLNTTVLAEAMGDTVIPVSCVERGRWRYRGRTGFAPSEISHPSLRHLSAVAVLRHRRAGLGHVSDQSSVWAEVERLRRDVGAGPSPTAAMSDIYRDRQRQLDEMTEGFATPDPGQIGVVACIDGDPVNADVFEHPSVLARLWARLIRGYAIEASGHPPAEVEASRVRGLLTAVVDADATTHEGLGLGTEVIATGSEFVAHALTWGDAVVHLAVYPVDPNGERPVHPPVDVTGDPVEGPRSGGISG